ncbi:helix-turn-helix domain-containing protein [Brucella anthropi]|uniref:Helix-turn-helix transcriptional regulator n=2 Tax=Brucella anthropi TaxID=529 RepID=A0A6L3Z001_BRUAN|nr:helix-turn-helix transcriptional regulator [Brucella anthropi]KAB2763054.1 helix-turn-helix transcriptional regulator [Brucella anthropi]UVV68892.1 helix-turn-helix domain-containing protein [Brucella anthropi]
MITPAQSRAARGLIEWSQEQLAQASHLGLSTIRDFEKGRRVPTHNNLAAIRRALEEAGVTFLSVGDITSGGAGVRLND